MTRLMLLFTAATALTAVGAAPSSSGPEVDVDSLRPAQELLPQRPSRSQVQAAMRQVTDLVDKCAPGEGERIVVIITVSGNTGRVSSARIDGEHAETSTGHCVRRAMREVRFPRFSDGTVTIRYPFRL